MAKIFGRPRRRTWSPEPEETRPAAHVVLTVRVHQEGPYFVGTIEGLDVSSFGKSVDEALDMTVDAVCTHLEAMEGAGEVEAFFEARGIQIHQAFPDHDHTRQVQVAMRPGEIASPRIVPVGGHRSLAPA